MGECTNRDESGGSDNADSGGMIKLILVSGNACFRPTPDLHGRPTKGNHAAETCHSRKEERRLIWNGTSCYLMTNGNLCPLMHLNLSVMSLISHITEHPRPAVVPLPVQATVFWRFAACYNSPVARKIEIIMTNTIITTKAIRIVS